ncbi:MAG: exodeoxyribonuclease VII small subunit [Spirochaetaceae bacterium]|nr:exodeoxyribonuclease VII small subunit [Spirochaetaceae bacterium]
MKDFEKKLARLETIAESMRDQNLPLEDAFSLFQEGVRLAQALRRELALLEGKVELLANSIEAGPDEAPKFEDIDALDNTDIEESSDIDGN